MNAVSIHFGEKPRSSIFPGEHEEGPLHISWKLNKFLFFVIVFLLLAFGIILIFFLINSSGRKSTMKDKQIFQDDLRKNSQLIDQLRQQIDVLEKEKSKTNITIRNLSSNDHS